jgi:tetratricopeptide (TPR) repeat protein
MAEGESNHGSLVMSSFEGFRSRADDAAEKTRQQSEFEIEFFRGVLRRFPEYIDVLRQQAKLLGGSGRREEALLCDQQLASVLPHDCEVHYHLACSLAALGKVDEAIPALQKAIELGYGDFEHLESDPDLESLHEHPQFQALLRGLGLQS